MRLKCWFLQSLFFGIRSSVGILPFPFRPLYSLGLPSKIQVGLGFMFRYLGFSSPEPKAHGELIVYQSSRCPSVCMCVNTFKHEYLHNQQADHNKILSEASLGRGKGCIRFWARSDWNSRFHGNR